MAEDWAAVARAVKERMAELSLTQLDLVERSQVSRTMVMEIRRNSVQRRRSTRTMEALSQALEWHPGYLDAVLRGGRTPAVGEPLVRSDEDTPARLATIEYRIGQMQEQIGELTDLVKRLDADSIHRASGGSEGTAPEDGRPWTR